MVVGRKEWDAKSVRSNDYSLFMSFKPAQIEEWKRQAIDPDSEVPPGMQLK
jgi:hypothetical protein